MRDLSSDHRYRSFTWMFLLALALIVTMAVVSNAKHRIHPDELDHVAAGRYYVEHWLPPPVADPRTLDSYSYAGMSYLNEWDIVYLLAGKFAAVMQPVVRDEVHAFRFFNVFLFLWLTCAAWLRRDEILTFSIVLVSPQIWYVFSYFNADAFALFVSLLAAYELTSARSAFNDWSRSIVARYLLLGVYVGLLILSKKTFWMFAVFALGYAALAALWHSRPQGWGASLRQIGVLAAVVCAVALPRIVYDLYINGVPSQKTEKIMAAANELADDEFKPPRIGSGRYSQGINLKGRGVGFSEMVVGTHGRPGWFKQSLVTSFGVYHYLLVRGPMLLYVLAAACVGLLGLSTVLAAILKGNAHDRMVVSLAVACCLGVVALSLYHSWVNDFQPQGRYLFAIFPILSVLLARSAEVLHPVYVKSLIGTSFLLSCCSFVFVGLLQIPKFWDHIEPPTDPVLKLEREWKRSR